MARPAQRIRVADVASLGHGEARTFTFEEDDAEGRGFVLMLREPREPREPGSEAGPGDDVGVVVAYRNRCAHVAFDLDMGTGQFWSRKLGRIYCRTHGACYEPRTGICDRGPCVGASLESFPVVREGPDAWVQVPAIASST